MKNVMLVALVLCLCFAVFGGSVFAEAAATEKPAAELYQAGLEALDAEDYGKALEYYQLAADMGNAEGWRGIGVLYQYGLGVEQDYAL